MKFVSKNQGGFTLLELLVVVGIIAIIGGAMMSSFSGQETKAARGVATSAIAGVENAMRVYKVNTSNVPNNMESLVCAPFGTALSAIAIETGADTNKKLGKLVASVADDTAYKFGGTSNASGIGGGMTLKLAEKFTLNQLTAPQAQVLNDAGVTNMRYAVADACDITAITTATFAANGASGPFGNTTKGLVGIDIPNQAFEDPRPDGSAKFKHRGIGYSGVIGEGSPVLIWHRGQDGYNNTKVGAGKDDILVAMGLGQASDLVGNGADAAFGKAPFYGQVGKDKYAHYIALVNIGSSDRTEIAAVAADPTATPPVLAADAIPQFTAGNAQVAAVVDARGDFLDEEIAEFQGQKI